MPERADMGASGDYDLAGPLTAAQIRNCSKVDSQLHFVDYYPPQPRESRAFFWQRIFESKREANQRQETLVGLNQWADRIPYAAEFIDGIRPQYSPGHETELWNVPRAIAASRMYSVAQLQPIRDGYGT